MLTCCCTEMLLLENVFKKVGGNPNPPCQLLCNVIWSLLGVVGLEETEQVMYCNGWRGNSTFLGLWESTHWSNAPFQVVFKWPARCLERVRRAAIWLWDQHIMGYTKSSQERAAFLEIRRNSALALEQNSQKKKPDQITVLKQIAFSLIPCSFFRLVIHAQSFHQNHVNHCASLLESRISDFFSSLLTEYSNPL